MLEFAFPCGDCHHKRAYHLPQLLETRTFTWCKAYHLDPQVLDRRPPGSGKQPPTDILYKINKFSNVNPNLVGKSSKSFLSSLVLGFFIGWWHMINFHPFWWWNSLQRSMWKRRRRLLMEVVLCPKAPWSFLSSVQVQGSVDVGHVQMGVSKNRGTQQPWVFVLKMIILGCFGGTTIFGNIQINIHNVSTVVLYIHLYR